MTKVNFDDLLKQGVLCGKKMVPVYCTTDLSIFKGNELNRNIRSVKIHEFMTQLNAGVFSAEPYITVLPDLTIADGHHRIQAIKEFLQQSNCPVKDFPVWFTVADDENSVSNDNYIHHVNTTGSMWTVMDHVKYYHDLEYVHYVYLYQAIKEMQKLQKEMRMISALSASDVIRILGGFSYTFPKVRSMEDFQLKRGLFKVRIKKEYITGIAPYFKEITSIIAYQAICVGSNHGFKQGLVEFLILMNMLGMDLDFVVTKMLSVKNPAQTFIALNTEKLTGVKSLIFDYMGIRFKEQAFKRIAYLADVAYIKNNYQDLSFSLLFRELAKLIKNNVFRPEGLYKQEELMNQQQ